MNCDDTSGVAACDGGQCGIGGYCEKCPAGGEAAQAPSVTAYAKQCRFYEVTVRGRRCEVTDHPGGRRTYFAWHEGSDKLREVPEREAALRAEIDAAITAAYGVGAVDPLAVIDKALAERKSPKQPLQGNMAAEWPAHGVKGRKS